MQVNATVDTMDTAPGCVVGNTTASTLLEFRLEAELRVARPLAAYILSSWSWSF